MILPNDVNLIIDRIEQEAKHLFKGIDKIALFNQEKVLKAFTKNKISTNSFNYSTGYGYGDMGRENMGKLISEIFHTESTLFSPLISSGTHALYIALSGLLRPNDLMLSIGEPYDSLIDVIFGTDNASLKDYNITCEILAENEEREIDLDKLENYLKRQPKLILITRSSGYSWKNALSIEEIEILCQFIKLNSPKSIIFIDNCYGEFVNFLEPTQVGADIAVGSFTKNIGGGLAPTGAYITGKEEYIKLISNRLTAPSLEHEIGSYNASYRTFYQGLFMAPCTVANALKGSMLFGLAFEQLGFDVLPHTNEIPNDLVRAIKFKEKEKLIKFIQLVQKNSPIDSHYFPEAWMMPGYSKKIIMASGAFIQGSSIELSADAPIAEPYIGFIQGGLTYEHLKIALSNILREFSKMQ